MDDGTNDDRERTWAALLNALFVWLAKYPEDGERLHREITEMSGLFELEADVDDAIRAVPPAVH